MTPDLKRLRRDWERAANAWNKDPGPLERTVEAGENLYFAATFLIERLEELLAERP